MQKDEITIVAGDSAAFSITPSGIKIRPDLTYEEWRHGLRAFKWAQLDFKIALADYIKYGEKKFGSERTSEAIEQLEFSMPEIMNAVQIGELPESVRKMNLPPQHLIVLAKSGLQEKDMAEWAETAIKNNLSADRLKESMSLGYVVPASARKSRGGVITIQAIRTQAELWLRQIGGLEALAEQSDEQKELILEELTIFEDIIKACKQSK